MKIANTLPVLSAFKTIVPKLPRPIQKSIRRHHYLEKLRSAEIDSEIDLSCIELLVSPGDTVLDIGANFGLFTRFLAERVTGTGKVFSFEPTTDMLDVLTHNVAGLGLSQVSIDSRALSSESGTATIAVPVREDGTLNHYEASLCSDADVGETIETTITTVALDEFCLEKKIEQISFIKIDVEGHELAVLGGARETLARFRPAILLEVNEPLDQPGHGAEVRELVESLGYEFYVFDDDGIRSRQPGDEFVNYVLKPG